jgi:hypothetical protein
MEKNDKNEKLLRSIRFIDKEQKETFIKKMGEIDKRATVNSFVNKFIDAVIAGKVNFTDGKTEEVKPFPLLGKYKEEIQYLTEDIRFLMDFFQANKASLKVKPEDRERFRGIAGKLG